VTITEARAELSGALATAGVPMAGAPGEKAAPYGVVYGDGIGAEHIVRGQALARFRVTLLAGRFDYAASQEALELLKLAAIQTVRGLAGWQFIEVRRDALASVAGGQFLAADVVAARMVEL
jgi:hypothetical protein